jgi:hypothetical protein
MKHSKNNYIDPLSVQTQLKSILRTVAMNGLPKALKITSVSEDEVIKLLSIAKRLKFDWNFIDPHGGRFSLTISLLSHLRIQ